MGCADPEPDSRVRVGHDSALNGGHALNRIWEKSEGGIGKGLLIFLLLVVALVIVLGVKVFSRAAPSIQFREPIKGIGQNTPMVVEVADGRHRLKHVAIVVHQGDHAFSVMESNLELPPWWKFWSGAGRKEAEFKTHVGRKQIPELQEGRATLHVTATNDSWGRFFRGGLSEVRLDLPVDFTPPEVQVLSFPHYVNLGGSELVVFAQPSPVISSARPTRRVRGSIEEKGA